MIRNDYRRALILLRSAIRGMSGHVRLERRTLGGSMRFSVAGAGASDTLRAVLMRRGKGGWTAVPMGALHVDTRGQAGLTWTFDPRNIEGHALEEYPVVSVVRVGKGGAVEPALSGFVNGSEEVDWLQAMSSVRALYRGPAVPQAPQAAEPAAEPEVAPATEPEAAPETEPVGGLPEPEEAEPVQNEEEQTEVLESPEPAEPEQTPEQTEVREAREEAPEAEGPPLAHQLLALDITIPWPEPVEPLRALFMELPACVPFDADGYTFVRAPLPGSGKAYSLVGVRVEDEQPTSVCYGIPGTFAPEPPAGLDGYMWRGEGVSGWWVVFVDAVTGEEVP